MPFGRGKLSVLSCGLVVFGSQHGSRTVPGFLVGDVLNCHYERPAFGARGICWDEDQLIA